MDYHDFRRSEDIEDRRPENDHCWINTDFVPPQHMCGDAQEGRVYTDPSWHGAASVRPGTPAPPRAHESSLNQSSNQAHHRELVMDNIYTRTVSVRPNATA